MDILDKRGEKRLIPSPSPSCDLDFDLRTGDSASAINPRYIPKKKVCFKSSQITRSALPADLLHADKDNIGKQLDGFVPSISGDSSSGDSCEDSEAAGEWKVVPPRGRGRNRFRSPPPTHPVTGTETGVTAESTAELSRRLKAEGWPGGVQRTIGNRQLATGNWQEEEIIRKQPEQVEHINFNVFSFLFLFSYFSINL